MAYTQETLDKMVDDIPNLPRDVRLACLQGLVGERFNVKLDSGEHQCNAAENIAIAIDLLGFYAELEELGLKPKSSL